MGATYEHPQQDLSLPLVRLLQDGPFAGGSLDRISYSPEDVMTPYEYRGTGATWLMIEAAQSYSSLPSVSTPTVWARFSGSI